MQIAEISKRGVFELPTNSNFKLLIRKISASKLRQVNLLLSFQTLKTDKKGKSFAITTLLHLLSTKVAAF